MTILENNVIPSRNKLSLKRNDNEQLKRKCLFENSVPPNKKPLLEDMLNGYRSDQKGDSVQESPVATLSNMGNTCFLNSVLYTLRFAPTFLHNLHHLIRDLTLVNIRLNQNKVKTSSLGRNVTGITGPSSRSSSSKDLLSLGNDSIVPKSKVQLVTEKLHELYYTMHSIEMKESSDPFQPDAFFQAIRQANYIFEGNHQQDAHELLVYLLDNIRETCEMLTQQVQHNPDILNETETPTISNNNKLWKTSWMKPSKKKDKTNKQIINEEQTNGASVTDTEDANSIENNDNTNKKKLAYNFVAEDFEGITLRRTKCLECECVTERKEPFYDIPVAIPDDVDNITNASEIYKKACVTSEKLCDSNKYLCEQCKRYNEASRDVLFEKLPNIMVLQLKRFTTTTSGIQKVNTYLPTPLELECFCETCCNIETPLHRYRLCCVIMHLGGSLASGHYIAYVKASDHFEDYVECSRDIPKGSLSASSSEKSLVFFKNLLKPVKSGSSLIDNNKQNISKSVLNDIRTCKSMDCCGVKLNKNVVENVINSNAKKNDISDMWLECDDENIRPITSHEFEEELSYKPNSTSTPYLLFYSKISSD